MSAIFSMAKKGILYLKANGAVRTGKKVRHYLKYTKVTEKKCNEDYVKWIKNCEAASGAAAEVISGSKNAPISQKGGHPLFSVCIPVYNVEEKWLRKCLESIRNQTFGSWQICLADDCSTDPRVREVLREYERIDDRIHVVYRKKNGHISRATNSALEIAEGEYVVLMDNDDEIAPNAFAEVAALLQAHPDADVIYSDEDKIDEEGRRMNPYFKPDYCPDTLLSYNYISHLGVYRKSLVDQVGGFRTGMEGAQDYDLLLRIAEKTDRIYHIPKILYHWRAIAGSTALDGGEKNYAYLAGKRALSDAAARRGYHARVQFLEKILCYNVVFSPVRSHRISIVLWCGAEEKEEKIKKAAAKLRKAAEGADKFPALRCDISVVKGRDNIEGINRAAMQAEGDLLLFYDIHLKAATRDWLFRMAGEAERKEIGVVGVKIACPNHKVRHAGVVIGLQGTAARLGEGKDEADNGYMSHLAMRRNYSAVSGECMMLRTEMFRAVGGFDEKTGVSHGDADLCLRILETGCRNIFLGDVLMRFRPGRPDAQPASAGSGTAKREKKYFARKWKDRIGCDPCYNLNFSLEEKNVRIKTE